MLETAAEFSGIGKAIEGVKSIGCVINHMRNRLFCGADNSIAVIAKLAVELDKFNCKEPVNLLHFANALSVTIPDYVIVQKSECGGRFLEDTEFT